MLDSGPQHVACATHIAARRNRSRPRVRNRFRVSVFRSWLLDTFGADYLAGGSGVLDVAGGKGELAFELLNLNGVPASVLDPRPMQLEQYEKRLKEGFYHFSRVFERYNGMAATTAATMAALDLDASSGAAAEPGRCSSPHSECNSGVPGSSRCRWLPREPRAPGHIRIFLTDQVVEAIGRLVALRRNGSEAAGSPNCPEWESALAHAAAAVLQSRRRAKQVEWTRKGFAAAEGHEEEPTRVLPAGHWRQRRAAVVGQRWRRCHISGGQQARQAEEADTVVDGRGEEAGRGPNFQCDITRRGDEPCPEQPALHPPPQPEPAAEATASEVQQAAPAEQGAGAQAAAEGYAELETEAEARAWAEGAVLRLLDCSVVAAMHPDQAAEFALRLALAAGKPFALVPCCVYAAEFPRRKLQSGDQVRSYTQLLAYLQELGAAGGWEVVAQELPFEGKNVLLYSRRLLPAGAPAHVRS
ncbi:hypothetical protein HYH02_008458 [Chlamydomonas schloesseri]|uniref:Methyltransferase domain-containing protein n=1 Tax=Chlamydomonas schloesseri TaxID=2026947 RepID=A0A836B3F2_9CHLO|nr:hypothetical protein HYH02_008458 [Chlamydomonas schloesseri]|eukprot:KAG2446467.1 hypothetical protein HYH02_008458 [Chlamydomonas schloesseri]